MSDKEFRSYVFDMKRQGLSKGQIATKLGLTLNDFEKKCEIVFESAKSAAIEKIQEVMEKPIPKKKKSKAASGAESTIDIIEEIPVVEEETAS